MTKPISENNEKELESFLSYFSKDSIMCRNINSNFTELSSLFQNHGYLEENFHDIFHNIWYHVYLDKVLSAKLS